MMPLLPQAPVGRILSLLLVVSTFISMPALSDDTEYDSAQQESPQVSRQRPTGFRFSAPKVLLGVRAGMNFPRAESDLFDTVTTELTLARSDFSSPTIGFDAGVLLGPRLVAVFSFEYGRTTRPSESRDYVELNGQPIAQVTRFQQMPITGTLRFYPRKQGEYVGNYSWVPNRVLPYIGGGGGALWYEFSQAGDFVDANNLHIFPAHLRSSGFTPTVHTVAGIDIGVTPLIVLNFETRYSWAKKTLDLSFRGFQPIDLSGLRASGGIYFRF
jgi:hypothetical protein